MEGVIGTILMFAGNFAPKSWAFCNGALINISTNTALFSILGTTYGGNGTTNFALPDLQGRVAVGAGQGPGLSDYSLGQMGGAETEVLSTSSMPAHNHMAGPITIPVATINASTADAANNILATPGGATIYAAPAQGDANYGGFSVQVQPAGGTQPFSIIQPYESVYFVICAYGIFPARN